MAVTESYQTIEKPAIAEFKDRGSAFIGYAFPVKTPADCRERLNEIKKEHAKATHHCFAWRLGLTNDQFRVSDDGEPPGTAGKPIMGQLESREITDAMIIVVRYFGGTLLGVPGLINAYRTTAALVLQMTPTVQKAVEIKYRLQFDYTILNDVMMIVKQFNCNVTLRDINLFCIMEIGVPMNRHNEVLYRIRELHSVELQKLNT